MVPCFVGSFLLVIAAVEVGGVVVAMVVVVVLLRTPTPTPPAPAAASAAAATSASGAGASIAHSPFLFVHFCFQAFLPLFLLPLL